MEYWGKGLEKGAKEGSKSGGGRHSRSKNLPLSISTEYTIIYSSKEIVLFDQHFPGWVI